MGTAKMGWSFIWRIALPWLAACLVSCGENKPQPGQVLDEAKRAGLTPASFRAAGEDYFRDMDGGIALTPEEIQGRNRWLVWTGGDDLLWDSLTTTSFGALDFLKTLSSHPKLRFSRDSRWRYLGLVNEPCFEKATGPDPKRQGLWLDKRRPDCAPDPFEDEKKYPGVAIGARGKNLPVGSSYGYATGIVGLRLFPNPAFDETAARNWDPVRYYEDPGYYLSKTLVRPYRVGMSCAFCHVGPNPVKPPADPENPKWENLSSNVGAQYFWIDRIFYWDADETNFVYQWFHTSRPGALDTSLVSTDNINNPRTMNALYNLMPRLQHSKRWGQETLSGGGNYGSNAGSPARAGAAGSVPILSRAQNWIAWGVSPNEITCRTQERSAASSAAASSGGAVSSIRARQSASCPAISGTASPAATGEGTPPAARIACAAST